MHPKVARKEAVVPVQNLAHLVRERTNKNKILVARAKARVGWIMWSDDDRQCRFSFVTVFDGARHKYQVECRLICIFWIFSLFLYFYTSHEESVAMLNGPMFTIRPYSAHTRVVGAEIQFSGFLYHKSAKFAFEKIHACYTKPAGFLSLVNPTQNVLWDQLDTVSNGHFGVRIFRSIVKPRCVGTTIITKTLIGAFLLRCGINRDQALYEYNSFGISWILRDVCRRLSHTSPQLHDKVKLLLHHFTDASANVKRIYRESNRRKVISEIIESEEFYVRHLERLESRFIGPILVREVFFLFFLLFSIKALLQQCLLLLYVRIISVTWFGGASSLS